MTQNELRLKADQLYDFVKDLEDSNTGDDDVDWVLRKLRDCGRELYDIVEDYVHAREAA
jgi:hypothetical protein